MIEAQEINGRKAIVAYFKGDFEPAGRDDATLVKVTYQDNQESFWLTPQEGGPDGVKAQEGEKTEPTG